MQYLTAMRYSAFSIEDVEGIELLRWEDQQKIRKYVEGGVLVDPRPQLQKLSLLRNVVLKFHKLLVLPARAAAKR